jgi:hypothetical protein
MSDCTRNCCGIDPPLLDGPAVQGASLDNQIRAAAGRMTTMRKTLTNILFVMFPTIIITLAFLELFFRFVIPATDPPMGYFDEENKMYCMSNRRERGVITIGKFAQIRARWRINNEHWNYPIDYHPVEDKKLIAVIGDSYIEAFQVDVDKNYPYLLRKRLYPEYEVYAAGRSGAALSQYLHMSRYLNKRFDPDVLIFNIVHNDFAESIRELNPGTPYFMQLSIDDSGSITETTPSPNYSFPQYKTWKRAVYKSALFRYLDWNLNVRQLRRSIMRVKAGTYEDNIAPAEVRKYQDLIYKAADHLAKTIREENKDKRVIFIFDAPKSAIYENNLRESKLLWMHEMMDTICSANDIEYIDLAPLMDNAYQANKTRFNSEIDGHWNEHGHEFVAGVLFAYLTQTER